MGFIRVSVVNVEWTNFGAKCPTVSPWGDPVSMAAPFFFFFLFLSGRFCRACPGIILCPLDVSCIFKSAVSTSVYRHCHDPPGSIVLLRLRTLEKSHRPLHFTLCLLDSSVVVVLMLKQRFQCPRKRSLGIHSCRATVQIPESSLESHGGERRSVS